MIDRSLTDAEIEEQRRQLEIAINVSRERWSPLLNLYHQIVACRRLRAQQAEERPAVIRFLDQWGITTSVEDVRKGPGHEPGPTEEAPAIGSARSGAEDAAQPQAEPAP